MRVVLLPSPCTDRWNWGSRSLINSSTITEHLHFGALCREGHALISLTLDCLVLLKRRSVILLSGPASKCSYCVWEILPHVNLDRTQSPPATTKLKVQVLTSQCPLHLGCDMWPVHSLTAAAHHSGAAVPVVANSVQCWGVGVISCSIGPWQ